MHRSFSKIFREVVFITGKRDKRLEPTKQVQALSSEGVELRFTDSKVFGDVSLLSVNNDGGILLYPFLL